MPVNDLRVSSSNAMKSVKITHQVIPLQKNKPLENLGTSTTGHPTAYHLRAGKNDQGQSSNEKVEAALGIEAYIAADRDGVHGRKVDQGDDLQN
jgi:hypothetical protein